jgi:hypothetical protein
MRLHTELTEQNIRFALAKCQAKGNIADTVYFSKLEMHRSTTNERAFEVQLASMGKAEGEKRREVNAYGVPYGERGHYSATWAEWGWLISEIFEEDASASWYRIYANPGHFAYKTLSVFDTDKYPAHLQIEAKDLRLGDIIVGAGTSGSGIQKVEDIEYESKKLMVTVGLYGGLHGYRFSEIKSFNPKRMVTVAR